MLCRLSIAAFLSAVAASSICAPYGQVISSVLTNDSWTSSDVNIVTISPQSNATQPNWLDIKAYFNSGVHPAGYLPTTAQYGHHTYGGYVRVKWVGASPPSLVSNYGGKYAVWCLRNGHAGLGLLKTSPGARQLSVFTSIGNNYVPQLPLSASASSPGSDSDDGGDFPSGGIYAEPLPSVGNNGNWTRVSDYVTAAPFQLEVDGYYYAHFPMAGITSFTAEFPGYALMGWNSLDAAGSWYNVRIAYQLIEVNQEPVAY